MTMWKLERCAQFIGMVQPLWKSIWWFLEKNKIAIWSSNSTYAIYSKELKAEPQRDICIPQFTALFITVKMWKQLNSHSPLLGEWIRKMRYIHTMEFSLKKKWNSDTCCNLGESGRRYAKWNEPVTKRQVPCDFSLWGP